jgi:hypothetical protein
VIEAKTELKRMLNKRGRLAVLSSGRRHGGLSLTVLKKWLKLPEI